jgi:hypothetical protein
LNVLQASLDWWYAQTYTYIASTFVVQHNQAGSATGWTLIPAATPFDVTSAVQTPTCSLAAAELSPVQEVCAETSPPVAAATTVLTQIAHETPTATTGTGPVPELAITPPPALINIPQNGGQFSAGTPFVFFSAYEIISKSAITTEGSNNAGPIVQCATTTATYAMPSPFSFEYQGADVNGQLVVNADVTGDVNPAFLNIVNVTNAVAGSWVAEPTVVVVMSRIVAVSQSYLATPTPTLPSGFSRNTGTGGAQQTVVLPATSMEWATALSLQLPDTAYAAQLTSVKQTSTASLFTGTPTNALQVLSQALATYSSTSSSASGALQVLWSATSAMSTSSSSAATTDSLTTTSASAPLATGGDGALADTSATVRTGGAGRSPPVLISSLFVMAMGVLPILI